MYQRWSLSPLRRFTHVTETYMSGGRWQDIPYHRVPSKCMAMNSPHFNKHDPERFAEYLRRVARGEQTISGATLLPHELLAASARPLLDSERAVVDAQWNSMVQSVRDAGVLDNCLAVCDVSGSMGFFHVHQREALDLVNSKGRIIKRNTRKSSDEEHVEPILPALALTIVLAQTAREPWRNQFITFSQKPELVRIDPAGGLVNMASKINATSWAMNTNYTAVFLDLILPTALAHKLPPSEMVKRLFVFSDMEWDSSRSPDSRTQPWATEHEIIKAAFEKAGYQLPEIVFWNLQGGRHGRVPRPVDKQEAGTALVTGFSPNTMKLFMEGQDLLPETEEAVSEEETVAAPQKDSPLEKRRRTPMEVMNAALERPSFAGLCVVD
ncbi:hypothetical protein BKA62DRAFT_620000 [Auriculariales sp. MPI-PUGE-AT-0066]|nr:hypothetical protein BKA62DRAFT_620000 [Auriculariales sp. MPI-PUGE-AT-0066]